MALGNSRSLWGWFSGNSLQHWQRCLPGENPDWASDRCSEILAAEVGAPERRSPLLASHHTRFLTPQQVPLAGQYKTLGLDRSLALIGAASEWGWPVLVVDGGTALTISAMDDQRLFAGGAILPGFALQGNALHDYTAALPQIQFAGFYDAPERWATSTDGAIRCGIYYGILAAVREFYRDWRDLHPQSPLVFTGGDGELLHRSLAVENSHFDPVLVLRGMANCRQSHQAPTTT